VWGQHLLAQADVAQYAAKRSGRNRVQLAAALAA
jgi:PleD family two-component response regulator